MKKSIVRISEGLGNQLFMYAHAYSFSKTLGYDLFIDNISAYKKINIRSFLLDNFNIPIKIANPIHIPDNFTKYISYKINKKIDFFRVNKNFLVEKKFSNKLTKYEDYTKINYSDNIFIEGYFESEKYFVNHKKDIIDQFQIKNIDKKTLFVNPSIILNENSVSIVIRQHRFDEKVSNVNNIEKSNQFVKKTINYILKATELIKSKVQDPKFYVFSNDTTDLSNYLDDKTYKIIYHSTNKPINDFYLSSLCKHFIVGPSTFHWWSAYLGTNKDKLCIRPPSNISFSSNNDIYPNDWLDIK